MARNSALAQRRSAKKRKCVQIGFGAGSRLLFVLYIQTFSPVLTHWMSPVLFLTFIPETPKCHWVTVAWFLGTRKWKIPCHNTKKNVHKCDATHWGNVFCRHFKCIFLVLFSFKLRWSLSVKIQLTMKQRSFNGLVHDKQLPEPMIIYSLTDICVSPPWCVKYDFVEKYSTLQQTSFRLKITFYDSQIIFQAVLSCGCVPDQPTLNLL